MAKIILFKNTNKGDNQKAPDYNVVFPVKEGDTEKLVTIGSAWNKTSSNGNVYKSISWKYTPFKKDDGTVYPAAKIFLSGVEFPYASLFQNSKNKNQFFLSLSRKEADGTYTNEFGSESGLVVGEGDKLRLEIILSDNVEVRLDYGDNLGTKEKAEQDFDAITQNSDVKYPTDDIDPEDIPF